MKLKLEGYFFRIRRFCYAFFVCFLLVVNSCNSVCIFSCFFRSWRSILSLSCGS